MNEIVLSLYSTNPGAWVSMGIVFLSVLTSWALNYSASRVRVFGTILAAVGCLLMAAWFFLFIINSGILKISFFFSFRWTNTLDLFENIFYFKIIFLIVLQIPNCCFFVKPGNTGIEIADL